MNSHLKSMFDQLRIPENDQSKLTNLHGIVNFGSMKAKKFELEHQELEQVDGKAQDIIAVALAYLESLKCSGDPISRFDKIDWIDFAIKVGRADHTDGMEVVEISDDDKAENWADDEEDATEDRGHSVRRKKEQMKLKDGQSSGADRGPVQLGKFELMDQGFVPGDSSWYDDEKDPKKADNRQESSRQSVIFNGRKFVKGGCYYFTTGSGRNVPVGIKSFKSEVEVNCVMMVHISKTFLGSGLYADEFEAYCKENNANLFVQVKGTEELSLSELGKECEDPDPMEIPSLIYEPQTPGSMQSFGYVRESDRSNRVLITRGQIRLLEGFSGAGGMHLGYHDEGYTTVRAVELNAAAVKTFKHNCPEVPTYEGDILEFIQKFESNEEYRTSMGRIDAVHLSSPCQGFSKANRNGGQNDETNNKLSYTFVDFLRMSGALVGVFENVEGVWSKKGMPYLKRLLIDCVKMGYQIRVQILRACNYGDPQKRPRMIIFAAKDFVPMPRRPHRTHGPGKEPYVTTKDAIDFLRSPFAQEHFPNMKDFKQTSLQPGKEGCVQLDANTLAPAVLASGPSTLHYSDKLPDGTFRCINVREAAALQSFPYDYEFLGTMAEQYKQAGNAVPVNFARAIARTVRESLRYLYAEELEVAESDVAEDQEMDEAGAGDGAEASVVI